MAQEVMRGDQPGSGSPSNLFEVVVNGKRETFDLTNPDDLTKLRQRAQMGTHASQRLEEANLKEVELQNTYKPYIEFDRILREDKDLEAIVTARLRGDPIPIERLGVRPTKRNGVVDDEAEGDEGDPVRDVEHRLRRDVDTKIDRVGSVIERIEQRLTERDRRDREAADEARINNHRVFRGWATENHIALAREAMRKRGGGLYENFVLLFEHEIPGIVAARERDSIPPDLRRTLLSRETTPLVIDGQTLTEESLAELYKNPDRYAKYKAGLRAEKRRRRGQQEYPR